MHACRIHLLNMVIQPNSFNTAVAVVMMNVLAVVVLIGQLPLRASAQRSHPSQACMLCGSVACTILTQHWMEAQTPCHPDAAIGHEYMHAHTDWPAKGFHTGYAHDRHASRTHRCTDCSCTDCPTAIRQLACSHVACYTPSRVITTA